MLCLLTVLAAASPTVPGVLLRYKFHAGESQEYGYHVVMDMKETAAGLTQPAGLDLKSVMRLTTTSVDPKGAAHVDISFLSYHYTGKGLLADKSRSYTGPVGSLNVGPSGATQNANFSSSMPKLPFDVSGMQIFGQLPETPVQVGSHWTSTVTTEKAGVLTMDSKVSRIDKSGGSTLVYVRSLGSTDVGNAGARPAPGMRSGVPSAPAVNSHGRLDYDITYVFDVSRGAVLKMSGGMQISLGVGAAMDAREHVNALVDGKQKLTMQLLN